MPRKSSVHFKPVSNVRFAVSHSERTDLSEPEYLLPKEHQLHNVIIEGSLSESELATLFIHQKLGMTGQAKARGSSPFWEGVVVLGDTDSKAQSENLQAWKVAYEKATSHKVLHMSIHLDEGYIDTAGKPQYNPHAHVIVSRMDGKNRVIKLERKELAAVQDLTAETLKMERGSTLKERQGKRGRKHIEHREYRAQADEARLDLDVEKSKTARIQKLFSDDTPIITGLKKELADSKAQEAQQATEIAQLNEQYRLDREALKASGIATQKAYQALKKAHEHEVADLKKELVTALEEAAQLTIENEALKAQETLKVKTLLPTPSPTLEKPVEPVFPRLTEQEFEELNARVVMEINPKVKAAARDVLVGGMLVKAAAAIQKLFPSLIFRAIKLLLGNYIAPLPPEPIQPDPTRVASRVPSKIPGRGVGR
jgi:hypothetical protein